MRVVEGTSLELPDGSWIKPEVEFSDVDLDQALVEWGINASNTANPLPLLMRYALMSSLAQMCLAQRVLDSRPADRAWSESVGLPAVQNAQQKLRELVGQAKEQTKGE